MTSRKKRRDDWQPDPDVGHALLEVEQVFDRWLYLEDYDLLHVMLATVVANRVPGDPLWMIHVSSPSTGKTETLGSIAGLPDVYMLSTITEAGLLSGSPRKDTSDASTGGLLRQVGDFGIVVVKDFTSTIEGHRATRGRVLAALREVYDGRWDRSMGTDGGKNLSWQGRIGLLAACTAAIDDAHSVMSLMGERFVLFRQKQVDETKQAKKALEVRGREVEMRAELASVVEAYLSNLMLPDELPEMSGEDDDRLIALAIFVAHARAGVRRDGYSKAVTAAPPPEGPARLVKQFQRLYGGLVLIGVPHDEAMSLVRRIGTDCIPRVRFDVLRVLIRRYGESRLLSSGEIRNGTPYALKTVDQALEDLTLHNLVRVEREMSGYSWRSVYALSLAAEDWLNTFRPGWESRGGRTVESS